MKVDIYNTDKKYDIIYADPPWAYLWGKVKRRKFLPRKALSNNVNRRDLRVRKIHKNN